MVMACPGCVGAEAAESLARHGLGTGSGTAHVLSLPSIHCGGCISAVERALLASPGVREARVNLTLKRASITAEDDVTADALIDVLSRAGFEAHELDADTLGQSGLDRDGRELLMRLGVAGFAAMNVMLLSVAVWSGAEDATRDLFHWLSAVIALPAIAFSAQPFFRNALSALTHRRLNMDVPISLAILLAAGTSLSETMQGGAHAYFDAALTLTFFLLAGRYLDHRTRAVARSAARELAALELPRATRITGEQAETVPLGDLVVGDLVRVLPGNRMPVDGIITDGHSELDRSLLTGETLPVPVAPGDAVRAGEITLTGPLVLRATAIGRDSTLHALTELVAVAEAGRANYSPLADQAARLYAPFVHILAALSFLGWYLATGDTRVALNIAAAVLIITCPCALGLAVPAVTTAASGRLFRQGLLVKHPTALERLAEVDTVVFDKTGTLTTGTPVLLDPAGTVPLHLALAAGVGAGSAHPLARALVAAARDAGITPEVVDDLTEVPGFGVQATWQGRAVALGRADWLDAAEHSDGSPATWLRIGTDPAVPFVFADRLRPGAAAAVAALQAQGLTVRLLSGDTEAVVARMAARVGIVDWQSRATPADKAAQIAAITAAGHRVLMVGDGLNDTAALRAAHISIAPAAGLDAARVAADIVLLGNDLSTLAPARQTARLATRRIKQNFQIATAYNIIAVPLAVAGLATPLVAALAMSISSLTVSLNALRLGRRTVPTAKAAGAGEGQRQSADAGKATTWMS
ncbi:heavy metal translocating P-type ATPase [Pseudoruegeria sp. SK021]|uniref:heavy metal translocating P-type ATPase n=1 Tax=Pseudoruegeria sp. SK021 TaxID=1933035 RepID=UPI000A253201|nr:heavy metal translocating P-type ATPase [Pseudoruegeria sp. SK021]OSP56738.1 ATPase [Pseudoruegeria sp. SK021]